MKITNPSLIQNKSVLVCGASHKARSQFIQQALQLFPKASCCVLDENIRDQDIYWRNVKRIFSLTSPVKGQDASQMNDAQLSDYHLEWASAKPETLIVIPECQKLYEKHKSFLVELLAKYLSMQESSAKNKRKFRVLMTMNGTCDLRASDIPSHLGGFTVGEKDFEVIDLK